MCLTRPSLQCDFDDDGTLKTANDNKDNIRRDLQKAKQNKQKSVHDVSKWCCRNRMALNQTKTKRMLMATRQKRMKNRSP